MLAADERLGYDVMGVFPVAVANDGSVSTTLPKRSRVPFEHIVEMEVPLLDGRFFTMVDYASAGKKWNNGFRMAAWIATK